MSELFGAPSGIRAAEEDMRLNATTALALEKGGIELENAKLAQQQQAEMLRLMQGGNAGEGAASGGMPGEGLPDKMDLLATMSMKSGMFKEAREYSTAASNIRHNNALVETSKANYNLKNLNTLSSLLQDVNSPQEWAQANAMFTMATGKESPYARLPYNPQTVEKLKQGITTAKDRALTDAAVAREKSSEAERADRIARLPLIKAQTKLAELKATALEKAGVTAVVKAADLRLITDRAAKDFDTAAMPDLRVRSRDVAARGLELMRTQVGLTKDEAFNMAYEEAKSDGVYGGLRGTRISAGSLAKPLDIPMNREGKPDKLAMKPNMFYKIKDKPWYWNGVEFVPAGKAPGEVSDDSLDEEDNEPNPDDEEAE